MDAVQLITMARNDCFTDTSQIPDVDGNINGKPVIGMLTYLNMVYRDFLTQVTNQVNEDLYCDIFIQDLTAGQIEYTIPANGPTQIGLQNILGVSVNYTAPVVWAWTVSTTDGSNLVTGSGTIFTTQFAVPQEINVNINIGSSAYRVVKILSDTQLIVYPAIVGNNSAVSYEYHKQDWKTCFPRRQSMLNMDTDFYIKNQPYDQPIFIAYDTGCFLYPQPTDNVQGWLKYYGTVDPIPLTISPNTSPIFEPTWHYILAVAMKRLIFAAKGMLKEKNDAITEYEIEFNKAIKALSERELAPVQKQTAYLTELQ